jgi:hypothetical protein
VAQIGKNSPGSRADEARRLKRSTVSPLPQDTIEVYT